MIRPNEPDIEYILSHKQLKEQLKRERMKEKEKEMRKGKNVNNVMSDMMAFNIQLLNHQTMMKMVGRMNGGQDENSSSSDDSEERKKRKRKKKKEIYKAIMRRDQSM